MKNQKDGHHNRNNHGTEPHVHIHKDHNTTININHSVIFTSGKSASPHFPENIKMRKVAQGLAYLYAEEKLTVDALADHKKTPDEILELVEYFNAIRAKIDECLDIGEKYFFDRHLQDLNKQYISRFKTTPTQVKVEVAVTLDPLEEMQNPLAPLFTGIPFNKK